jgi:hypothetical protein
MYGNKMHEKLVFRTKNIRKLPRSGVVTVVEICVDARTKIENIV